MSVSDGVHHRAVLARMAERGERPAYTLADVLAAAEDMAKAIAAWSCSEDSPALGRQMSSALNRWRDLTEEEEG